MGKITHRNITILYNQPGEASGTEDIDTLEQLESVKVALEELGAEIMELPADQNLPGFIKDLREHRGNIVFNLTDPLSGEGRFISIFPLVLEQQGFSYTGCSADALYMTSNKILSKKIMTGMGLPTPFWMVSGDGVKNGQGCHLENRGGEFFPGMYIIKSVWEHGSAGLTADSLINASCVEDLQEVLEYTGGGVFAERFLPGREINVGLLSGGNGKLEVLPPSEIIYRNSSTFLDYSSKWDEGSDSYRDSTRSLKFDSEDDPMLRELSLMAGRCAGLFCLNGYARVDFRMDENGRPFILEVNANPCLTPGAGFPAGAEKAGISYKEMIRRIAACPLPGVNISSHGE